MLKSVNGLSLWERMKSLKAFQYALIAAGALLLFIIFRKVKSDKKTKGTTKDNSQAANTLSQNAGGGLSQQQALQRILELKEIAENMSKDFWSFRTYLWGGIVLWRVDEDEEDFIQQCNRLQNATEVDLCCDYYREYNSQWDTSTLTSGVKGLSLKADAIRYLSSSELARIASFVKNSWR